MDKELLELSKTLYEATGWDDTEQSYWDRDDSGRWEKEINVGAADEVPAYDLEYILDKLPVVIRVDDGEATKSLEQMHLGEWMASYRIIPEFDVRKRTRMSCEADTPLKAALKLAITLSEQGILTKESK